ncbi:T9SS type B sorting domain-containing protein [Tenacibaculum geojense]|uniref:T9SS type B sorting domain-containing protein n=1 Tax=Tenacibaculum geojense TaxID=915352 RepID=A0ABW3JQT1_9FLAO
MKFKLFILILIYSISSYSQCFDCAKNIGQHTDDSAVDIEKTIDGIVYAVEAQWKSTINKYDFNCNLVWSIMLNSDYTNVEAITSDELGNIYLLIQYTISPNAGSGPWDIDGFQMFPGINFFKLSPTGLIYWSQHIDPRTGYEMQNIHYFQGQLLVTGTFYDNLTFINGLNFNYPYTDHPRAFIAKYDTDGNFIDANNYGNGVEDFKYSEFDNQGNIYLTSSHYNSQYSNISKFNSSLQLSWSTELSNSNTNDTGIYVPNGLRFNSENNMLYVWGKISQTTTILGNSFFVSNSNGIFQSVLTEFNTTTGALTNFKRFDNNSGYANNSSSAVRFRRSAYMAEKNGYLYVLTSFRGNMIFPNETITSTINNINGGSYSEDLLLFKVNLSDFSSEFVTKSSGIPNLSFQVSDLPGPIVFNEDDLYLTATFGSKPMQINSLTINNNSGNNDPDAMYYKFNISQNSSGLVSFNNTCLSTSTEFNINGDFDSVLWNFDDPSSGLNNTSTLTDPSHNFTSSGTYNVSALVTCGSETETIEVEVIISSSPTVNQINNLYSCEDNFGSQISSTFDTSSIENNLIGNQSELNIKYFNSNGIELPSPLPNPMTNSILGQETITARVAYNNNLTCFTEITFDLIVNPLPELNEVNDIFACDDNNDGIADFDISNLESIISDNQSGMILEFFYENGQPLPNPLPNTIQNMVLNQETITARLTDPNSNCYNESSFDLIVNPLPEANQLQIIYGCDDNNDGISEYFDTSNIESQVLNGQTDKLVSYFDQTGNELPNPLPNPYTNSTAFNELITVRVTDNNSTCYAETTLQLQTITQPNINQPNNLYACDQGNGYAEFNTSNIEQQLIGNQTGLSILYYDSYNNPLPSPLPVLFQNTEPFSQTINVRVEDVSNPICYSETSFDLIVNELPEINLKDEYYLCNLELSISLSVNSGFNSYDWSDQNGTSISNTYTVEITEEGSYTLTVTRIENGIACENSFDFTLVRSVLPEIQQINFGELGNNYIEIIASGDGDFEYSIDDINYQDSNYFSNIKGGIYTVFVRDKDGCGQDSEKVTIIDYPKFFTPNNDGYNDFWQINGIINFPNSETIIFDRYGKPLARITPNDLGWDGFYNGKKMISNDYWFKTNLGNGRTFYGHFSLKR